MKVRLFRLFHGGIIGNGGIIGIIQNNLCGIPIILLILFCFWIVPIILWIILWIIPWIIPFHFDYSDYSSGLFRLLLFSFFGLFAPDNFHIAFPPLLCFPGHWDGPVMSNQGTTYKFEPFVGAKRWIIAIIAITDDYQDYYDYSFEYSDYCFWIIHIIAFWLLDFCDFCY